MASVSLNPVLETLSGKIGDLVFRRFQDETVVSRSPRTTDRPPTAGQAAQRESFRRAVLYGRAVMADAGTKAVYEAAAKATGRQIFATMVSDYLNAPAVEQVDLSAYTGQAGETLRIRASDDFTVAAIAVRILDTAGQALESGAAVKAGDGSPDWEYRTTATLTPGQAVSIEVTATDRPGHKTVKVQPRS